MSDPTNSIFVHHHFLIYKPYGYLSQLVNNQNRRKNKKLLGELYDFPEGTMAIGRLDEKSEGLLLMTTNGKLSSLVRSTKFEKEYLVQTDGSISEPALVKLRAGVEITVDKQPYLTIPCRVELLEKLPIEVDPSVYIRDDRHGPTSWISITLTEGKFRQVRKMTAAVGYPTLRLVRYRIAEMTIDGMQPGEVVQVTKFDL